MVEQLREFHVAAHEKTKNVAGERMAMSCKPSQEFIGARYTIMSDPAYNGSAAAEQRKNLIDEEATELLDELELGESRAAMAKEVADLLYVTVACAVLYDIPIEEVFNRVHENNMLKIKNATIRPSDGKIVKAPDHPKVDLSDLFNE